MTDPNGFGIDFRSVGDISAMAPPVDLHISLLVNSSVFTGKVVH
jgi:hypothetical protein